MTSLHKDENKGKTFFFFTQWNCPRARKSAQKMKTLPDGSKG